MEQGQITEKLIQYLDGTLPPNEAKSIMEWIDSDAEVALQYEQLKSLQTILDASYQHQVPSERMTGRFENWLDAQKNTKVISFTKRLWSIAAAILVLVISGVISWSVYTNNKQKEELAIVKAQLEQTRQMVLLQLQNPLSASSRITAVHASEKMMDPDEEVIEVLVKTLNEDPNSNVRMASLDALSKFYAQPNVKKALLESMKFQKDPVVQIALIQLLVQMKEKNILSDLQKLIDQPGTMKAVKDEAYQGIFKLT